jgi:ferredoxin
MAFVILDNCNACGLCVDECPIEAIEVGDPIYVINDTCCEFEECVAVCPEDAIVNETEIN